MTGQEQQQPQASAFNQRADAAASVLKADLSRKLGIDLPSTKVKVGPDGKSPAAQLPPEGSYARAALDREQAAQASIVALDVHQAPPVQQPTAEELAQPTHALPEQQPSARAQERIADLVSSLREKDQQLQQTQAQAARSEQELRQRMQQLEAQYEQMVRQQLESLDPDTRMEVLQSAAIQQAVAASEQRIISAIGPRLQRAEELVVNNELANLANKYPGFQADTHVPLIKLFREKNPHCSLEQAFRAVATIEELGTRSSVSAPAVPPSIPPGRGSSPSRYVPQTPQPSNPEQELRQEADQAYALLKSVDPTERKRGMQLVQQNLTKRLGRTTA